MKNTFSNPLIISSYNGEINRVFEDYCNGIKANCEKYQYIDYINSYIVLGKSGFERHVEETITRNGCDCIFFIWWSSDLTFDLKFLQKIARTTPLVMNFFDTEYFFESIDRYYAQLARLVILPDSLARYKYQHLNIPAHTSFAMYDGNFYSRKNARKDIDVSFIGNMKQADRADYVDYLIKNGINVKSYGIGSQNGFCSYEEMIDIFNRSKINLNFTTTAGSANYIVPLPVINQRIRQSKGRPIEVALCGGFILSQYAPGIEEMFEIGSEIDVFSSKEELLEKIRYYLNESDKREAMAERSYQKSRAQYEVKNGFKAIFNTLKKNNNIDNYPLYTDPAFMRAYSSSRFFYIACFLLAGRFSFILEELCVICKARKLSFSMAYFFSIKGFMFVIRRHPKLDFTLKAVKNKLGIKVKY